MSHANFALVTNLKNVLIIFACVCRMLQPRVSRDVIEGGSVHVWLDLTSEFYLFLVQ